MQQHRAGIGETRQQRGDRAVGILQECLALGTDEQGFDRPAVLGVQPRLGALQHGRETIPPGDVQPGRVVPLGVGGAVTVTDRQFDVTLQPLLIGHLGDIAEVGLGGGCHGCDDLVATRRNRLGVTGDVIEQPAAPRCRVVDLVDIRAELAASRCHAVQRFSGTHPLVRSGGVGEQLLDGR